MRLPLAALLTALASACGPAGDPALRVVGDDPSDDPVAGATADDLRVFADGDRVFDRVFRPSQGLGPVFIQSSCRACHGAAGRGPGSVTRLAVLGPDGVARPATAPWLPYGSTARPRLAGAATRAVTAPTPAAPDTLLSSVRIGPAVFGRGWIEAVSDDALCAQEFAQAGVGGPVSGRVNRLADGRLGRLGVKARHADLESFAAEAFQGDMGLTSPRAPTEVPNPEGITDDLRPGVDLADDVVRAAAGYVRRLAIPARVGLTEAGRQRFAAAGCAACHVAALRTRADYPVAALAGRDAPLYSDLLLHDLGPALADGVAEGSATGREWRTAPLVGLRFFRSFLHDGRARTLDEAVRQHGGPGSEAADAVARYAALAPAARAVLLDFVGRL